MIDGLFQQPLLGVIAVAAGGLAALIGGALSGYVIGGKDLGAALSTQIGGLFGVLSGLPGVALALFILMLIG